MYTKTDLARFYACSLPKLRRAIAGSGVATALPKLAKHKALLTDADMEVVERYIAPCPGWRKLKRARQ